MIQASVPASHCAPRPSSRNGTPRPSEYTASRSAPRAAPPEAAARVRIAANTGPMHGVHPAANAIPNGNDPVIPGRTF